MVFPHSHSSSVAELRPESRSRNILNSVLQIALNSLHCNWHIFWINLKFSNLSAGIILSFYPKCIIIAVTFHGNFFLRICDILCHYMLILEEKTFYSLSEIGVALTCHLGGLRSLQSSYLMISPCYHFKIQNITHYLMSLPIICLLLEVP